MKISLFKPGPVLLAALLLMTVGACKHSFVDDLFENEPELFV